MSRQIKKSDVVNLTGGVETKDGRTLYGMDAEQYLKMQSKEDPEYNAKIVKWIEDCLGEKLPNPDLFTALKSGVILCRVVNKIRPKIITKFNDAPDIHPLMEIENINFYLKACWRLGIPSGDLFTASDLHMGRGMSAVVGNLSSLSRVAKNTLGFAGEALGPNVKPIDVVPVKKWAEVADLVDDGTETLVEVKKKLDAATARAAELAKAVEALKHENDFLKTNSVGTAGTGGGEGGVMAPRVTELLGKFKKELETKGQTIKDLDEQCIFLERQLRTAEDENKALKLASSQQKESVTREATQTEEKMKAELEILKKEHGSQLDRVQREVDDLKRRSQSLTADNTGLKTTALEKKREFEKQLEQLESDWKSKLSASQARVQAQIRTLTEQSSDWEKSAKEFAEENEQLRAELKKLPDSSALIDEWKGRLELEHSKYRREIEKLETDAQQAAREIEALKQENRLLQTASTATAKQQQVEEKLRTEIELLKKQYSSKVDELNGTVTLLEKEIHRLTAEKGELAKSSQSQEESSASKFVQLKQENESLKKRQDEEISALKDQLSSFEREVAAVQRTNASLLESAAKAKAEVEEKEKQSKTATMARAELLRQNEDLAQQISTLERKMLTVEQSAQTARSEFEKAQQLAQLQQEAAEQKFKAETAEAKRMTMGDTRKFHEELERVMRENELLTQTNQELAKANADLEWTKAFLTSELETAKKGATPVPAAHPTSTPPSITAHRPAATVAKPEDSVENQSGLAKLSRMISKSPSIGAMDSDLRDLKRQIEQGSDGATPGGDKSDGGVFYYSSKIDDNLLLFCKDSLKTILQGTGSVVYDDMGQLNQLFKFDTGRRLFCFLLQFSLSKKEKQLANEAFEVLLFLINSCLTEMAADAMDYQAISIIMDASTLLFQISTDGTHEFIRKYVKSHFIWQAHMPFWEQRFFNNINEQFKVLFKGEKVSFQSKAQKDFAFASTRDFCLEMLLWSLSLDSIKQFIESTAQITGLQAPQWKEIMAKLELEKIQIEAKKQISEQKQKASLSRKLSTSSNAPASATTNKDVPKKKTWFGF